MMQIMSKSTSSLKKLKCLSNRIRTIIMSVFVYEFKSCEKKLII